MASFQVATTRSVVGVFTMRGALAAACGRALGGVIVDLVKAVEI